MTTQDLCDPVGEDDVANIKAKLKEVHIKIMEEEERIRLLKNLRKKGLFTRDILAFIIKQSEKRLCDKSIDTLTAGRAMNSKIRDATRSLHQRRKECSQLKTQCLVNFGNKRYKLRRLVKNIKKNIQSKE